MVLDFAVIRGDNDAWDTFIDEFGGADRLGLSNVAFTTISALIQDSPEEKLAVQVGNVDRVHVDDMYIVKAAEGEVLENLASQSAGADDKYLALISEKVFCLCQRGR